MAKFAVLFGACLIAVGYIGYYEPKYFGEGNPRQIRGWACAFISFRFTISKVVLVKEVS